MSTISTKVTIGITLTTSGSYTSPLSVTGTGYIDAASGDAIYGDTTQPWIVVNSGTIVAAGTSGAGVDLKGGGYVLNNTSGRIAGSNGAYYYYSDGAGGSGGAGIEMSAYGNVGNAGTIAGGAGGVGQAGSAQYQGGTGGAGGVGVALSIGGSIDNNGTIAGGNGGAGGAGYYVAGAGGSAGAGIVLSASGSISNTGMIAGGTGGYGGDVSFTEGGAASGGAGGAGLALSSGGTVANYGQIVGGQGGHGGSGAQAGGAGSGGAGIDMSAYGSIGNAGTIAGGAGGDGGAGGQGGAGGSGGAGIALSGGGIISNTGTVIGGAGGQGGAGSYNNGYRGGYGGGGGTGIMLSAGGSIDNTGTIAGGQGGAGGIGHTVGADGTAGVGIVLAQGGIVTNGSIGALTALISGRIGIAAYGTAGATVTDYGTISGSGGTAVYFGGNGINLLALGSGYYLDGVVQGSTASGATNTLELMGTVGYGLTVDYDGLGLTNFQDVLFGAGGHDTLDISDTAGTLPILISGFTLTSDVIDLTGIGTDGTITNFDTATDEITVEGSLGSETLQFDSIDGLSFTTMSDGSGGTELFLSTVPCFARGTMILTEAGEVAVEDLKIGDRLVTRDGAAKPIKWIGRRAYDGHFVRGNPAVLPILVKEGALGDGVPARDLYLSPQHALFLDGVLVPAECLVNGVSVVRCAAVERIEYFNIEFDSHDVLYAEGAAAESYVDCDNRGMFQNAAEFARLYPGEDPPRWAFCAPRVAEGEPLAAVRGRLARRLAATGAGVTSDPDLRLMVDGRVLPPESAREGLYRFRLAGTAREIRLLSRSAVPAQLGIGDDRRRLGVSVYRIGLAGEGVSIALAPEAAGRAAGFHGAEDGHCWSDGDGVLPSLLTAAAAEGVTIEIACDNLSLYPLGRPAAAAPAGPRPRALVIDDTVPRPGYDAGSTAVLDHMRALARLGWQVGFAAQDMGPDNGALTRAGIETYAAPDYASVAEALQQHGEALRLVYLHRVSNAVRYRALVRRLCPEARLIYSVADLHWLRLERQARSEGRLELMAESRRLQKAELRAAAMADAVVTHSEAEAELLRSYIKPGKVHVVPWAARPRPRRRAWGERHGIAFIGSYSHTPNLDAARWLVEEIMPLVWQQEPAIECLLAGSEMPEALRRLAGERVAVLGHVADLDAVFERVRLTAAPLRFGAGIKGKVIDSLAAGVPCAMTPLAAEGLPLPAPLPDCIVDGAEALARLICRLHEDEAAQAQAAEAGLAFIRDSLSEARIDRRLAAALPPAFELRPTGSARRAAAG